MADCRICVWFKPRYEMTNEELEQAYIWLAKNRPDKQIILGWCSMYNRPVTYYTGKCRGFKKKQRYYHSLDEYIKR